MTCEFKSHRAHVVTARVVDLSPRGPFLGGADEYKGTTVEGPFNEIHLCLPGGSPSNSAEGPCAPVFVLYGALAVVAGRRLVLSCERGQGLAQLG